MEPKVKEKFINEIVAMQKVTSNYLVRLIDVFDYQKHTFIVYEKTDDQNMLKIIERQRGNYSENFCKYTLHSVALAIRDLHLANVLHRDIKAENICCDGESVRLVDFEDSVFLTEDRAKYNSQVGMVEKAPEGPVENGGYGLPIDIWALGIFAYELAVGQAEFSKQNARLIERENYTDFTIDTTKFSESFQQFIEVCLTTDPAERPTIEDLLANSFFCDAASMQSEWKQEY